MSTLLDGYLLPDGNFQYCESPNCYAKTDICRENIANLECQLDGWTYGVITNNNLSYLYTEITAPAEYYSDYPRVCGITNRFPSNNNISSYGFYYWWLGSQSSINTQRCDNDFGDCNFPRIKNCKNDRSVTRIDPCALKIGKDKEERCCRSNTPEIPVPCESGSCNYTFQIVKKTYSIDYELVKPSYICGNAPSFPSSTCLGLPSVISNTVYASYPYCTPKSKCEPYPCNPDNLKIPSGCVEIADEWQRMSLSSWGGSVPCGSGGYSQLDGGVGQQGSNPLGCNASLTPLGAALGITYSYPNGSYNGYGAIRWHYYPENCESACDTCTDYSASDCNLACYTNGNYPWWFNGTDYLAYVGTDCCYENVPIPCPTIYIDYEENTKPWYCAGSYCTQDVIGGGAGNGPYATKTECERACSDSSCIDVEGVLLKGWCCDQTFLDQMNEDIATGCYEQQPAKDISRSLLLCNNGDGDKAEFDKPATRCYYNKKFTKTYKEVQNYRQKIVACSTSIPDRAYFPLINCAGLIGTDGYRSCFEYWSEVYTGSRQNYQYPANADPYATITYTFYPEEIVSEATVQLTSVFCNLIINYCE